MEPDFRFGTRKLTWATVTLEEFCQDYTPDGWEELFEAARDDLIPEISEQLIKHAKKNVIYPPMQHVFNALETLQPDQIKVVLIGQDPYINPGEAMGWSFSVPKSCKIPPSLRNIYKELTAEGYTGYKGRKTGDLSPWVEKGVFLYNSCLTVNQSASKSHGDLWSEFTDLVVTMLNNQNHIAWILLGVPAQKYASKIDKRRHGVFMAGHPSPLNRNGTFSGCGIFQKAEEYLQAHDRDFSWNTNTF